MEKRLDAGEPHVQTRLKEYGVEEFIGKWEKKKR
jgi:hypothetical protein